MVEGGHAVHYVKREGKLSKRNMSGGIHPGDVQIARDQTAGMELGGHINGEIKSSKSE